MIRILTLLSLIMVQALYTGTAFAAGPVAVQTRGESQCAPFVNTRDEKLGLLIARIEAKLSPADSDDALPAGAAVAIVYDGKLISAEGVGHRGKEGYLPGGPPVDRDTLFWVASTSKLITAAGAMALVDKGKLDLMRPVTAYLPHYTEALGRQNLITVDNLLRMNSGLNNDGSCAIFSQSMSEQPGGCVALTNPGPDQVLENMFSTGNLLVEPYQGFNRTDHGVPGEATWEYANWGFMLAGRIMEVAAGQPFSELIRTHIFKPAGMCSAVYDAAGVFAHDNYAVGSGKAAVDGYCAEPELGHDSVGPWYPDELACPGRNPNGNVRASALDLGRFAEALLNDLEGANRMMSQAAAAQIFNPKSGRVSTGLHSASRWGDTYGYGNFHHTYREHDVYTHGGGRPGFGTLFWLIPERGFAVIITHNFGKTNYFNDEMEFAVRCYLDGDCD